VVVYLVSLVTLGLINHRVEAKLNEVFHLFSSRYTARTALGIRQKVEQVRANVFLFNLKKSATFFTPMLYTFFRFFFL